MFQNLRTNSSVYILHKDSTPKIDLAAVVNVSSPRPKFPVPQQFGQAMEMVVDVDAKIGEQVFSYKGLPANGDIADSADGIVISTSRDAMNAEIVALKQKSVDIISSVKYHEGLVKGYDKILESINPEFAEKQAQQAEINGLKQQVGELSKNISQLLSMFNEKRNGSDFASKKQ